MLFDGVVVELLAPAHHLGRAPPAALARIARV
jgi:hypothetical protein